MGHEGGGRLVLGMSNVLGEGVRDGYDQDTMYTGMNCQRII